MKAFLKVFLSGILTFTASTNLKAASWDSTFASDFSSSFELGYGCGATATALSGTTIYAAIAQGWSTEGFAYLAKWTPTGGWTNLADSEVGGQIHTIVYDGTDIYVGGEFTGGGVNYPVSCPNILRYSLSAKRFYAVGGGLHTSAAPLTSARVLSLASIGGSYT